MLRVFCSTGTCDQQAAQLGSLRRLLATARYERDAAVAQAAALAEDNAKLRAELEKAQNGHAFYMGLYCENHTPTPHAPQCQKIGGRRGCRGRGGSD